MGREENLMARIKRDWGQLITAECKLSSVPEAFIAALIANESGGKLDSRRFEPHVYNAFQAVLMGNRPTYNGLNQSQLLVALTDSKGKINDAKLRLISSSIGLTQIMGFHVLRDNKEPEKLLEPKFNLRSCLKLLACFHEWYGLDLRNEFSDMFKVWNTGSLSLKKKTFDPGYINLGLLRINLYRGLSKDAPLG